MTFWTTSLRYEHLSRVAHLCFQWKTLHRIPELTSPVQPMRMSCFSARWVRVNHFLADHELVYIRIGWNAASRLHEFEATWDPCGAKRFSKTHRISITGLTGIY